MRLTKTIHACVIAAIATMAWTSIAHAAPQTISVQARLDEIVSTAGASCDMDFGEIGDIITLDFTYDDTTTDIGNEFYQFGWQTLQFAGVTVDLSMGSGGGGSLDASSSGIKFRANIPGLIPDAGGNNSPVTGAPNTTSLFGANFDIEPTSAGFDSSDILTFDDVSYVIPAMGSEAHIFNCDNFGITSVFFAPVPEPASASLFCVAALGLLACRRRFSC